MNSGKGFFTRKIGSIKKRKESTVVEWVIVDLCDPKLMVKMKKSKKRKEERVCAVGKDVAVAVERGERRKW